MTKKQILDNLSWLKVWLEKPPAVDWGKNYECAEALEKAIEIIDQKDSRMNIQERTESILKELDYANYISHGNLHEDGEQGCRVIEAALKKTVPMKPTRVLHTNRVPGEQEEYYCPNCDEWIT